MADSEQSQNSNNIEFLMDQIKQANDALKKGKLPDVPEEVKQGAQENMNEFIEIVKMQQALAQQKQQQM